MKPEPKTILHVDHVSHWFGDTRVLYNVNLYVKKGEIVSLVGPSGCGKSTLLYAMLGTQPPLSGNVLVNDKVHDEPSGDVGIVEQGYNVPPFLNVIENVALGLKLSQSSIPFRTLRPFAWRALRSHHWDQAEQLLKKVGLDDKMKCWPADLSGGQRQRVAIAQALIMRPMILLLDEPFGALDLSIREELQNMILDLGRDNVEAQEKGEEPPYTILIVTHELEEAIRISSRIVGLSQYHAEGSKGSTIVYDEPSPVYIPGHEKEYIFLQEQKEQIRRCIFPNQVKAREEKAKFWQDYQRNGNGKEKV